MDRQDGWPANSVSRQFWVYAASGRGTSYGYQGWLRAGGQIARRAKGS